MSIDTLKEGDLVFLQDDTQSEPLEGKVIRIDRSRWFQLQVEVELVNGLTVWAWGEELFPRQEGQNTND